MKIISNQINPHFRLLDALQAFGQIFSLKTPDLTPHIGTENFLLTNTARTALGIIADTIQPDRDKKIALPAFICAVVATPFLTRGYQIEWIDVDEDGVMSVEDFKKKLDNVSLVVVPHIFGQSAPLKAIHRVAKENDIFVIEDGAHLMTTGFDHCDAKIWSFGREKVISCVSGGALLWPEGSPFDEKFKNTMLKPAGISWQIRHALQPLIFALAQPWWHIGGKYLPGILRKINLLPLAVTRAERNGIEDIPRRGLGKIQQRILVQQWKKHRSQVVQAKSLALVWQKILPKNIRTIVPNSAFRVIVKFEDSVKKSQFLSTNFTNRSWHLRDWDGIPVSPTGVDLAAFGYQFGQCPQAETYAQTYLTLPTNVWCHQKDLKRLDKQWSQSKMKQI